jgi:hypothetical protein
MSALPLPPLVAVLLQSRRDALAAFLAVGWRSWDHPAALDAERRRALNIDLSEPEVALGVGASVRAVAHVETDRDGLVTYLEVVASEPQEPARVAAALLGAEHGDPRTGGGVAAREWIWGPESGSTASVAGEPVRVWICAEQAYGDRLWTIATVVRRAGEDD